MINIFKKTVSGLVLLLAMCCFNAQTAKAQPGEAVSIQTFYDELEPYGQWIDDPELGYVWAPDAGPDFKPYATNGHWAATKYGNTWVSDYDWGWAAFHYGRWRFANDYGWEWIPGTEWGPAWVNWRTGGDYYGWAPLGPGINIDLSFGANYYQPDNYWVFAPRRSIYEPNIYRYYVPVNRNYNIIHNTTIISNVYVNNSRRYISGPRPDDVRRYTNAPVNIYNINNSRRPGGSRISNNTLNIYRPQIASNQNNDNRPEPNRTINRGSYNRNLGFGNNDTRNQSLNNGGQPVYQRNQQNAPLNNNNGFGRNNNSSGGNQLPQRTFPNQNQTNPNQNNTTNGQAPGSLVNPQGNNLSNSVGSRSNPTNQPAQVPTAQPNNNWRQSRDFDHNRTRNDFPIQQNQNQQNQNQQMQQRQQENQQRQIENQQRQQQNQNQQMQQRQQPQNPQQIQTPRVQREQPQQQQQRPARQETPERNNRG